MRISLDVPEVLLRRAKSAAKARGVPLGQFVAEALREKLLPMPAAGPKPWMKHLGNLKPLHKETKLIEKRIKDAFEQIDEEE